jgi:hypothetical protein
MPGIAGSLYQAGDNLQQLGRGVGSSLRGAGLGANAIKQLANLRP